MDTPAGSAARDAVGAHVGSNGAVAAAHPLAVTAALDTLAAGGSAADATVAAQAVIAVALPEAGGLGGDALALVRAGGCTVAVNGTGAAAAGSDRVAVSGGASVTVPGAVDGWLQLHERFGRLDLATVLAPAIGLARDGVTVEPALVAAVDGQRPRLVVGGAGSWPPLTAVAGDRWTQPELAECLATVALRGRSAFYEGPSAAAISRAVAGAGGTLTVADLAGHASEVGPPLQVAWHGSALSVQPPMSQGVLLAMAAQWLNRHAGDASGVAAEHLLVEATEAAFGFRSDCSLGSELLDVALEVDPEWAARRGGPRSYLHTAGVAVADRDGQVVSSLLSVFDDFGSGVFVPELGFVLNNRAAGFTGGRNAAAPGKRPVHTLAPALLETTHGAALGLATPGADGQVQTLLQVLWRLRTGEPLSAAVAAPRWRSQDGRLLVESGHPAAEALADRGHDVELRPAGDPVFGAVVAAGATRGTTLAAGDWRRRVASAALPSEPLGVDPR